MSEAILCINFICIYCVLYLRSINYFNLFLYFYLISNKCEVVAYCRLSPPPASNIYIERFPSRSKLKNALPLALSVPQKWGVRESYRNFPTFVIILRSCIACIRLVDTKCQHSFQPYPVRGTEYMNGPVLG